MSVHKGMARSGIRRVTARDAAPDRFGLLLRAVWETLHGHGADSVWRVAPAAPLVLKDKRDGLRSDHRCGICKTRDRDEVSLKCTFVRRRTVR